MLPLVRKLIQILDRAHKRQLLALQVLMIFVAALEVIGVAAVAPFIAVIADPGLIQSNRLYRAIYEFGGFADDQGFYLGLGVVVLTVIVVGNTFMLLENWLLNKVSCDLGGFFSRKLFEYFVDRPYLYHTAHNSSQLASKVLNETQRLAFKIVLPLLTINSRTIVILMILAAIVLVDPMVALVSFGVFGAAYAVIYLLVRAKLARNGGVELHANQRRLKVVNETFGGIKEIKIYAKEAVVIGGYRRATDEYFSALATTAAISSAPKFILELIAFGGVVATLLFMLVSGRTLAAILPLMGFYAMAGYRLIPALQRIFSALSSVKGAAAALDAIALEIREMHSATQRALPNLAPDQPIKVRSTIELDDVVFRYPGTEKPVLKGLSLRIEAFSTVGFIGASGAGKSTVVDLILGLIIPDAGAIRVDGVALDSEAARRNWQASVGYVPQSIFLVDDSIAQNIAFGVGPGEVDDSVVRHSAEDAHVMEFASGMLEGLATNVGERGVQLSGGQRQRLGIARALYRDPDVLILDEATSALDGVAEDAVIRAVRGMKRRKTVIMVAHRLTTLRDCDRIFLFKDGRVADSGTYAELLDRSAEFRAMAKSSGQGVDP